MFESDLRGKISDDEWRHARIDASTHAIQTVEYEHHEIHGGSSFHVSFANTTSADDDHRSCITFTTPAGTKYAHLIMTVSASSPAEAYILEAFSAIDEGEGTEKTIYNRNRNSSTTSTMISHAASPAAGSVTTWTETQIANAQLSGGTAIEHIILAGGEGPRSVGGTSRGTQEWVLDADKHYMFYIQNIGANANTHNISLDWYEHTDKD
jgi:hypothetical protein